MTKTAKLSEENLRHITGSENWHRFGINRKVLCTDGAKHVADEGGAYWLLDAIAIAQLYEKAVAAEESTSPTTSFSCRRNTDGRAGP
jgi:hypothetical protein